MFASIVKEIWSAFECMQQIIVFMTKLLAGIEIIYCSCSCKTVPQPYACAYKRDEPFVNQGP